MNESKFEEDADLKKEEHPSGEEPELPTYAEDGTDLSLIRWMLTLTPLERLRMAQNNANSIARLQNAKRTA